MSSPDQLGGVTPGQPGADLTVIQGGNPVFRDELWADYEAGKIGPEPAVEPASTPGVSELVKPSEVPLYVEEDIRRYEEANGFRQAVAQRRRDRRATDRRLPAAQRPTTPEHTTEEQPETDLRRMPFARYLGQGATAADRAEADAVLAGKGDTFLPASKSEELHRLAS